MKYRYCFFLWAMVSLYACGNGGQQQFSSDIRVLNRQIITDAKAGIQTGDVIMRSGKDFTSYRIRELSDKDKTYSHAGMAIVKNTNVYVYHITPPDLDEPRGDTAMRLEPLEKFANPDKCFGFGIVRYQLTAAEVESAVHYLDSLYEKKVSFDHYFNLEDAHKMYCSEMIDNTLRYATHDRIMLTKKFFTKLQAAKASRYFHRTLEDVRRTPYISIDNMQLNPYATAIHNYVFLK